MYLFAVLFHIISADFSFFLGVSE